MTRFGGERPLKPDMEGDMEEFIRGGAYLCVSEISTVMQLVTLNMEFYAHAKGPIETQNPCGRRVVKSFWV